MTQIDAKGQIIAFQYDSLNRPVLKEYPDQTNVLFTYDETWSTDAVGRLTTVVDNSGATLFYYDCLGRTSQVTRTIDSVQYNTAMMYDPLSHITQITYPDGDTANYSYDGAGNMSAVSNSASVPYASFSGYNALGQPGQVAFQNGASTSLSYYPSNNRLWTMSTTTPGSGTVQSLAYGYDNNGNILAIADSVTPANSQTFTYDGLNRLVTAQSQAYNTINISYDLVGNIQTNADSGNPADRSSEALTYDFDNRVTGINGTSFVYDYTGARVKKTTGASITTCVSKLYDITNGTVNKHIFAGGTRIASKSGSSIYYYHPDHLGSLSIATDGSGTQRQAVTYYPFGEVRTNTGTVDLPYKFTGHELDPETGLYYCGARYYDSAQGRFITPDTIVQSPGDPQSLNRYAYARNNPLAFVDPSGHFFIELLIGLLFGALMAGIESNWNPQAMLIGGLVGGISGGVFAEVSGATSGFLANVTLAGQMGPPTAGMMMFGNISGAIIAGAAAGATAGGLNAAIYRGNIGKGMLMGAGYGALSGAIFGVLNQAISSGLDKAANYGTNMSNMQDMDKVDPTSNSKYYPYDDVDNISSGTGKYIEADLGQGVRVWVQNVDVNVAHVAIYTNYGSDGADLMGMQDQTFQFYGPLAVEPIKWAINIYPAVPGSTFSLLYRIDSTWVPMGLDYTLPTVPLK